MSEAKIQNILSKFKILSGSMLKLIAIISMIVDHTGLILFSESISMHMPFLTVGSLQISGYYLMRRIGRLAFPIFCFLLTEGYVHTKDKRRYARSLLLFAIISEIPFNLMVSSTVFNQYNQNIYFTLFIGFLCIYIIENINGRFKQFLSLILILAFTNHFLHADYGLRGVLLIILMYALRSNSALQAVLSYPLLSGGNAAFAAFIPINMYNGKRGFIKGSFLKYLFYAFYPVHIIILLLIKSVLS